MIVGKYVCFLDVELAVACLSWSSGSLSGLPAAQWLTLAASSIVAFSACRRSMRWRSM